MKTSQKQKVGIGTLVTGLALLASSTFGGSPATSVSDMSTVYGGACYYCGAGVVCNDIACYQFSEAGDPNNGKYVKATGNTSGGNPIAEAVCRTTTSTTGKKTCVEDTSTTCFTQTWCDNAACTMNCSTTTISVNNNCTMTGTCEGS
jgi:hypothetical protein